MGNISVLARPHPELDPLGVKTGVFDWFPAVTLGAEYNDNILATQNNAKADAILSITPAILIKSDWNQNGIGVKAYGILSRYQTYTIEDSNQVSVAAFGTLNAYHDLTLTGQAGYAYLVFARTADAYTQVTIKPLLYGDTSGRIEAVKEFNHLTLTVSGLVDQFRYSDGLSPTGEVINEQFRDRTAWRAKFRADVPVSRAFGLFVEENLTRNDYTVNVGRNDFITDTLFGTKLELSHFLSGEIAAGYYTASFADPLYGSVGTFDLRADLIYFPTELLNVTLAANRGLVDSGLPGSPVYMSNTVALRVDYELLRSLILSAQASGIYNSYRVLDRQDTDFDWSFIAAYRMNRAVTLNLTYQHLDQVSVGADRGPSYVDNQVLLSVTFQR